MKKILLLNTPFYRLMGSHYNGLSLGILYVAAVLKKHGHDVSVLNADYENRSDYLDQKGIFNKFDQYKSVHEDTGHYIWNDTVREILSHGPDLLGITMFTANFKAARIIAGKIKEQNDKIKIVVGGVHPTLAPNEVLGFGEFDYVISGEGEYPFLRLANGEPPELIPGLGYKDNGRIIINPVGEPIENLDELPFPSRDAIINPPENTDFGQLITGRGCPFSCSYCASPAMWSKKKVRMRSIENVVDELALIKRRYPHNVIYFVDDTFTLKRDRTTQLCKEIIRRGLDIKWKCDTRADCLTEETVGLMKKAGCVCIKIGAESGSERILKLIDKRISKEMVLSAARIVKRFGIPLTVYLMAGFPEETDEDLRETINFAKAIDANYYSLSIAMPYYGTRIYDDFVKNNGDRAFKEHWEYFYHQSRETVLNDRLSEGMVNEFLSLNDGRGNRI